MDMKRILSLLTILALMVGIASASSRPQISRIDPPHWWAGMRQDTLQLMVYGSNIANASATLDYPGVDIAKTVRLESPDYLLLYLVVGREAQPGTLPIRFIDGNKATTYNYQLLRRKSSPQSHVGFDCSDVLYLVMPDRFARGSKSPDESKRVKGMDFPVKADRSNLDARHGGDIAGLHEHLDYLDTLGVTALWVNPVLENDMPKGDYHGYATTDYYRIDPRLGTNDEWNAFVEAAHGRGMKVVMDMIFNHCGSNHVWFNNRPSRDWFNFPDGYVKTNYRLATISDPYASKHDRTLTTDGWFSEQMPDLNQRNPHLLRYLTQCSIWWVEESGIDGIRMDTHPYADFSSMAQWLSDLKGEYPNFNIVGECWVNNEGAPAFWQADSKVNAIGNPQLPTVMDFPLQGMMRDAVSTDGGLNRIYEHLGLDYLFTDPSRVLTFLDNHDTDRFLKDEPADLSRWKQAMTLLLTTRGIPQLYYGDEIAMSGTMTPTDGSVRLDFPGGFVTDTVNAFTAAGRTALQNEAFDFLSKLLHWRRNTPAVKCGSLLHFIPQDGIYVYQRRDEDGNDVVILMNGNDRQATMDMSQTTEVLPVGSKRTDMLTSEVVTIGDRLTFLPRQILILQ